MHVGAYGTHARGTESGFRREEQVRPQAKHEIERVKAERRPLDRASHFSLCNRTLRTALS